MRVSARLPVQDGQYAIWDCVSELTPPDPGGSSGLVGTAPGLAVVITGTQFGNVGLTVQVEAAEPDLDLAGWEEIAEVSLTIGAGHLGLTSGGHGPSELSALTDAGPGDYRIRLHARGRDIGAAKDVVGGGPVEEHLVQIWPAQSSPETVHKTTDEVGAGLRAEFGPWSGPRGPSNKLEFDQPITDTDRATASLRYVKVVSAGCMFEFRVTVEMAALSPQEEKRGRRAVEGYARARLPGSHSAGPLQVMLRYGDGRTVDSENLGSRFWDGLRPDGPVVFPLRWSIYPQGSRHVAEIGFWSWPLPPDEPFELIMEWPAVCMAPASITLDGAAINATMPHES